MMRKLMQGELDKSHERDREMMSESASRAIAQHVQPLQQGLAQERIELTQQITQLHETMEALETKLTDQSRPPSAVNRMNTVVIVGFTMLSNEGAIAVC